MVTAAQRLTGTRILPPRTHTSEKRVCNRCGIDYTPRNHATLCKDCRRFK